MPVAVDCAVTPSRRRWFYLFIIALSAALLVLFLPISPWFACSSLIVFWLAHIVWQSDLDCDHLSFRGVDIIVSHSGNSKRYSWRGQSIRSHAFISLTLHNNEAERASLTLWRDSVSAEGWRALNMAIRVHESQAKSAVL